MFLMCLNPSRQVACDTNVQSPIVITRHNICMIPFHNNLNSMVPCLRRDDEPNYTNMTPN
jgi:hypothetical protein